MKIECTKRQLDAAAQEYLAEKSRHKVLQLDAEDLLKEGEYVQRERVLKEANDKRQALEGMKAMAEAVGIPGDVLVRAASKKGA